MAKIVVAGKSDCPYYAKVELLADELSKNLPEFKLHKIVITPENWQSWLSGVCDDRGWTHYRSPIVWRELVDRGGKGVLIGGANDFQEYANGYYELASNFASDDLVRIADENLKTKEEIDEEERERLAQIQPINVCVTCTSKPVAYHLIPTLLTGEVFGDVEIALNLLEQNEDDDEDLLPAVNILKTEIIDTSYPQLRSTKVSDNVREAFKDAKFVFLLDDFERGTKDETDWMRLYFDRYTEYARVLDEVALHTVKVIVACRGPVNFVIDHMIRAINHIPRHNIVGLSRLVENQVKTVISQVLKVNSANVADAIIWGNVHGERYIDLNYCKVHHYEGAIYGPDPYARSAKDFLYDKKWLEKSFAEEVTSRTRTLEERMSHSNDMSRAAAIRSLIYHWNNGCKRGEMYSLAVHSDGWYEIPYGVVFSVPVLFHPSGSFSVVENIDLSELEKAKIDSCVKDLRREYELIYLPPTPPAPPTPPFTDEEMQPLSSDTSNQVLDGDGATDALASTEETGADDGSAVETTASDADNQDDAENNQDDAENNQDDAEAGEAVIGDETRVDE